MSSAVPEIPIYPTSVEGTGAREHRFVKERQFLAALIESSEDAIIGESLQGIITSWNRSAEKMFGYSSAEAIGQSVEILHSPGDAEELVAILDSIREGKCASHFETRRRRRDGTQLDVSVSVSPVFGEGGEVIGGAKIIRDITDQKRSEELLRKAEKLAVANRLAASVAHEINNPLAALTNILYLLRSTELSPDAMKLLEMAEREMARVTHIMTQALGFYQDNSSASVNDISTILDQALYLHSQRIEVSGIRVEKRYRHSAPVLCHAGELKQVFVNLIGNALEAMGDTKTLQLRSRAASCSQSGVPGVRVTVADTGCGMVPEALDHAFEPFFTTRGAIRTGLGLWMCAEIVKRHRGKIKIRSSEAPQNHGTIFSIFLPLEL